MRLFGKYLAVIILIFSIVTSLNAQRLSRDLNVSLLVNQAGYMPYAAKICVTKGRVESDFEVIDIKTQQVVHRGVLQPTSADFGNYLTGDFSSVIREGRYYIKSDTIRSYPFSISSSVYQSPMNLIVHYFSKQRCGPSATGYLSPCHLDDGVRMDNGKHQDVTGGWHDASDLRKWVGATIYGMLGLAKAYELTDQNKKKILEELMWGNRYFLSMQEPQGYIMNYIGGDVQKHSDSNRWTDNETGEEEGELRMIKPNAGESNADMLVVGNKDDRVIRTDPLDISGQYVFVATEALMARIAKKIDPEYSDKCLAAAQKGFEWCVTSDQQPGPGAIGPAIQAALELYKINGMDIYRNFAIEQASRLEEFQAEVNKEGFGGFFFTSPDQEEPFKNIWKNHMELISLCDLAEAFPAHNNAPTWKAMISNYANEYLRVLSENNNFGIVPFGLFTGENPGGDRKIGDYWYRYFMQPERDWWVGVNANLASAGVGFIKASRTLRNDPGSTALKGLAQRQLDWIIGVNPFSSSTLIGVGYNHPEHFPGSTFIPRTPVIPGAVMNGLGGDHADQPVIGTGNWQISEYWTPMVATALWLMAELSD